MPRQSDTAAGLLSVPNLYPGQAVALVDAMRGRERAAKVLRVAPELLDLWLSGEVETPRTALLAMYWQSEHGFHAAFSESHWTHQYNSTLKNEARSRVEALEAVITHHGLPMPPGRLTTHKEMLTAGPLPASSYAVRQLARSSSEIM